MMLKQVLFKPLLIVALAVSIPTFGIAADSTYDAYNVSIQPGVTEEFLNFTWLTTNEPLETTELIIYDADDVATSYVATCETVEVEESSSDGSPTGATIAGVEALAEDTDDDTTDEETTTDEEEETIYSCKVSSVSVTASSEYSYIIGDGTDYNDRSSFNTRDAQNYNFIFVGDPQIGASRDAESDGEGWATTVTAALTSFPTTSFILSAGDQVESSTSDTQYDAFLSATELTSLPFAPAIGNHDTSELYAYHFNVPNESELGATDGGGDYWFTYGDTLFMVLNTNNDSALSHSEFMTEAIEANADVRWKVLVFHHSIYSSARHVDDVNDLRTSMYPVVDEHDIDIVLSGHDHFYARTYHLDGGDVIDEASYTSTGRDGSEQTTTVDLIGDIATKGNQKIIGKTVVVDPEGTVFFTANSASGSKYYDYTFIDGYTNYYLAKYEQIETPTYLNVEINNAALTVSSYRVDTGELLDSYTISKKRSGRHSYE